MICILSYKLIDIYFSDNKYNKSLNESIGILFNAFTLMADLFAAHKLFQFLLAFDSVQHSII